MHACIFMTANASYLSLNRHEGLICEGVYHHNIKPSQIAKHASKCTNDTPLGRCKVGNYVDEVSHAEPRARKGGARRHGYRPPHPAQGQHERAHMPSARSLCMHVTTACTHIVAPAHFMLCVAVHVHFPCGGEYVIELKPPLLVYSQRSTRGRPACQRAGSMHEHPRVHTCRPCPVMKRHASAFVAPL